MTDPQKEWLAIEWVANVPEAELAERLKKPAPLSQRFHYLLFADGSIRPNRALEPDRQAQVLVLREGAEASSLQLGRLDALRAYVMQWNIAEDKARVARPEWLPDMGAKSVAEQEGSATARSSPAAPAPVAPSWPAFVDPGAFTGAPEQLRELALHVVNLRKGVLSDDGIMTTDAADIDDMVASIAAKVGQGYRPMLYAHGGLTDERSGLASAWAYHRWWMAHGIYPVYFIWETGGLETFWQIVEGERRRGQMGARAVPRDIYDYTTDPAVELIGGRIGTLLWNAMKDSARRGSEAGTSETGGGARLFAQKLGAALSDATEIFAVGHSAGSIFHAHFLPVLCDAGLQVSQLHLLAPAITNALFAPTLGKLIAQGKIGDATLFAMTRQAERADNCANIYRKSLLYLVSRAFEGKKETPILGMEDFIRVDPAVKQAFGDDVILSPTSGAAPTMASGSQSHGGFDNDVATIENIVRRMRGLGDGDTVNPPFPPGEPRVGRATVAPNYYGMPADLFDAVPDFVGASPLASSPETQGGAGVKLGAQRVALCIGNDGFPEGMRLYGCINDANTWADTFRLQGYQATVLPDLGARQIREALRGILGKARAGDSVMIHISSHGSRVLDVDGDELNDKHFADGEDEALVALDWRDGGLIIDDEWPELMQVAAGVKVIRFHDFCHSGRSSRMALGSSAYRRARSVSLPDAIALKAYDARRGARSLRSARAAVPGGAADLYGADLSYVTFCACLPHQSAMEEAGSGVFTRAATKILRGQGAGLSADALFAAIAAEMAGEQQEPLLEGSALYRAQPLFGLPV
ncbi:caspase family protein [Novosphingobium guangzhouense]|nr:caspase family protein [Novosphingobium guangzhouense]